MRGVSNLVTYAFLLLFTLLIGVLLVHKILLATTSSVSVGDIQGIRKWDRIVNKAQVEVYASFSEGLKPDRLLYRHEVNLALVGVKGSIQNVENALLAVMQRHERGSTYIIYKPPSATLVSTGEECELRITLYNITSIVFAHGEKLVKVNRVTLPSYAQLYCYKEVVIGNIMLEEPLKLKVIDVEVKAQAKYLVVSRSWTADCNVLRIIVAIEPCEVRVRNVE